MANGFNALDRILRGEATRLPALLGGSVEVPLLGLSGVNLLLAMVVGTCTGLTAVVARWHTPQAFMGLEQMAASAVKVPMLVFVTLLVTFPSLYVFNALVGSRLSMGAVAGLLTAAVSVMMALLASFAPIVAFFALSTTSYPFMKLLNVIAFAVAGFMGLAFLMQTLHRLTIVQESLQLTLDVAGRAADATGETESAADVPLAPSRPAAGALERVAGTPTPAVRAVFRIWMIVFGLVGAQMSWVLRPFVGDPDQPFSFFRPRQSNFFEAIVRTLESLFSGGWGR